MGVGAAAARARARACLGFWCGGEWVSGWWASEEVAPPMGEEDSKRCRCRSESPRPIPRRVPSSSDRVGLDSWLCGSLLGLAVSVILSAVGPHYLSGPFSSHFARLIKYSCPSPPKKKCPSLFFLSTSRVHFFFFFHKNVSMFIFFKTHELLTKEKCYIKSKWLGKTGGHLLNNQI